MDKAKKKKLLYAFTFMCIAFGLWLVKFCMKTEMIDAALLELIRSGLFLIGGIVSIYILKNHPKTKF